MKAQSAIEYFAIATMILMFMVPIWLYMVTTQDQATRELSLSYSKNAVKQIADTASLVHSQGYPSKLNIKVYIPDGLSNVSVIGSTLIFNLDMGDHQSEIWYKSNAPLQGGENIPLREGYYYFDITSYDTYVEINRTV